MEKDFVCIKIRDLQCEYICHQVKTMIDAHVNSGKILDDSFIHISIRNIKNIRSIRKRRIIRC